MSEWTEPYYGVTHLGQLGDRRRVTVTFFPRFATLDCYLQDSGFYPRESTHTSLEDAKVAGEAWIREGR
jgi:hypothetical protein